MFIVIMGVSGCGKTTVGQALAARLSCKFIDGDDYHPPENVARMAAGIPLTDQDRKGWLDILAGLIARGIAQGETGVLACSALKAEYRHQLCQDPQQVRFVYLKGSYDLIFSRVQNRKDHFMKTGNLQSQFDALEEPSPSQAIIVDIRLPVDQIVDSILTRVVTA